MRTSTAFFLVVFLVVMSSAERRSSVRHALAKAGHELEQVCGVRETDDDVGDRTSEGRALEGLAQREASTAKALRTIERGLKSLDDKIERMADEDDGELRATLRVLKEQRLTLDHERAELTVLKSRLQAERVRIETQIDLSGIRSEKEETERFLGTSAPSPIEQLADER